MSSTLKVRFKVFDHDLNDEDDFMGSHKAFLDTSMDNSKLHGQVMEKDLKFAQDPTAKPGKISFRLFFNAFDVWQEHGMRYIDMADSVKIDVDK